MSNVFYRRLSGLSVLLIAIVVLLLARLGSFQFQLDTATYLQNLASKTYHTARELVPIRGRIFDRNGNLLAGNEMYYDVGISPNLVFDAQKTSAQLVKLLSLDPATIKAALASDSQYVALTQKPVNTTIAQQVADANIPGVVLDPKPRRIYPQGALAGQVIGFVGGDGKGYVGVEGYLNKELAGQNSFTEDSPIPFEVNSNTISQAGDDIYLTIDRSIQALAETSLQQALKDNHSPSGSVIITDPRNGEILAMASYPSFDPNAFYQVDPALMRNPAVSDLYEPGSVFKIVTMSSGLDSGKVPRSWTYNDTGVLTIGGQNIYNWDHAGHGSTTFDTVLIQSYNIGTSRVALAMGSDDSKNYVFYNYLTNHWGVNQRTGVDMEGEATGVLHLPGDSVWSDSYLATNSFGQGLEVTPLQMIAYTNVIANNGKMMQPHVVLKRVHNGVTYPSQPYVVRAPISADSANQIRDIMVQVINSPAGEGHKAAVDGYTIAGKTGTAQFYNPDLQTYDPTYNENTFVGFLPADEPRVSVLFKIDRLNDYASQTTAPAFSALVSKLVVLMNIPDDNERNLLKRQGGNTALIPGGQG